MPGAVPPGYFGGAGGNFPPTFGSANGIATLPPVAPQHQDHRSMLDVSCSSYQLVPRQHMLPPPPGGCDPPMMQLSRAPTAATAVAASRPVAEPQQQQQPSQPSGLQCHLTEDGSMAGSSGRRVRQRICTAATQAQAATQKPADESRLKLLLLRLVPELKKVEEQQRLKVEQMLEAQRRMKEERGLEAEQRVKELAAVRALLDSESLQPDGAVTAPTAAERELFDMLIPSSSCIKKEPPLVEHTAGKLQLLRTDLQHLAHGNWLNDELINYALRLLQDGMPNVLFMNTFFYGKLYQDKKKYSYAEVQRWTAPKRLCEAGVEAETILDVELVVVPIHLLAHFICFIIDVQARVIRCYDSLGHSHDTIAEHLARYMEDEAENKKPQEHKQGLWDRQAWRVEYPSRPGQTNGCDCGVFTIKYAQYGSAGRPFDFTQDDMPNLRIKLLADLFRQRMV